MKLYTSQFGYLEILTEEQLSSFYYKPDRRVDLDLIEDSDGSTYEIYEHVLSKKLYALEI